MATIKLQGSPVETAGDLPVNGETAPAFTLVKNDLSELDLASLSGKTIVLNIFPSIDTPVCAMSVRKFNEDAGKKENVEVLCISADLPFAFGRFCGAEGIENVTSLSTFRNQEFGTHYGVLMTSGPLKGLMARAVVVIGPDGAVRYSELVSDITNEPDYDAALAVIG